VVEASERGADLSRLSPYERRAWHGIQGWKDSPGRRPLVPDKVRRKGRELRREFADAWDAVPFSTDVDRLLHEVVEKVVGGGLQAVSDAMAASVQRQRILEAARDAGADVDDLGDLRALDLEVIDRICPRLNIRYAMASAATGGASGFVAGGGSTAIVGTGGVAAAPGALAIAGALAADVVATIAMAARVVTHYAAYYGYDAREEEEKAVVLAVIGVGVVAEDAAKRAAMLHVRRVAMMIARRATWKELGEEAIVKLIEALFAKLSVTLTKRKLAQALPAAGVVLGMGFNYRLMRKVGTAAYFAYRERFLIEKCGIGAEESDPGVLPATPEEEP
jgi:hypothetical protein